MNLNFFKDIKILDGGMGQELLAKGLISKGTLWSASAMIEEQYHQLVINTHLSFIDAGADVILTNSFTTRRVRFLQNKVDHLFNFANQKSGELAAKAREISKKNILIAGALPAQNNTYQVDERDMITIQKNFFDQAILINPYIDFFYLDVISSGREIEIALNVIEKMKKPVLVGLHIKKNGKLPSNETISEILKKYKSSNWLGLITACVSMEIVEKTSDELKNLDIPFGFKVNLWNVEEPLPIHRFNKAKFNEVGINPNITMGKRKDVNKKIFGSFAKKIINKGATILGGCCETNPSHIRELSKLK
tara:strand:+ start:797 stop:1714 length:918 start_codon:yes stop_codon:yes gene_type:complete